MLEKYKGIIELIPKDKVKYYINSPYKLNSRRFMEKWEDKSLDRLMIGIRRGSKERLKTMMLLEGWTIEEDALLEIYCRLYGKDIG
jgi:hypothetical protein